MNNSVTYYPSFLPVIKAVTIVAHGLNQRPEAMVSLVRLLNSTGSDVFLACLSGHTAADDMGNVTVNQWTKDIQSAYNIAADAALKAEVPLFFLGYSLGALLAQTMILQSVRGATFDKQVLIAPAIAVRSRSYLLKLLFPLGLKRKIRSYSPEEYRVHSTLPLLVYRILFTEEKKLVQSGFSGLNTATLIVIDPEDEMIGYKKLVDRIRRYKLSNYKVITVKSKGYHHLIINEKTMGEENWQRVSREIASFLFPGDLS